MKSSVLLALANDVNAFNDNTRLFAACPGGEVGLGSGTIAAANDANFDSQFLSEPLNDYIVGALDPDDLGVVLDSIAPAIPVSRSFTYRKNETKEDFQIDADDKDIREIGGDFAQTRRTGTTANGRTANKGLTMVIDVDQGGEDASVQQRAVLNLRNRLYRTEISRVITLLDANDTPDTSVNWGATNTTADPDADILTSLDTGGDARGVDSNIVLFGGAWLRRNLALRRSVTEGAKMSLPMTRDQLAEYYGVDRVVVMKNRYQSTSSAKAKLLTNDVYNFHVRPGGMPDDPANIKRFVSGGQMQVYVERRLKKVLITVEHYSSIDCTSTLGIRKLPTTFT
jgi:hypothetical protein